MSNRINILVTRPHRFPSDDGARECFGPTVMVRNGYTPINLDDDRDLMPTPEASIGRGFEKIGERFDATTHNSAGSPGAFVNVYPVAEIRAYLDALCATWGNLHIQDNSGLFPEFSKKWIG
ncbi:hypothetical protein HLH33_18690 [Gluconacetobacter diazotrophicus]|uniref:Uncharacterized protein n=1 Tax=Gluconacetobacter diazotrophicus TaxID=33996 RepID=A0A7W4NN66_GLUDI|nr:hypothetical protein [Gluconacetobacter diazotrophicus]MBB2158293.1 hypothetical protein [Gluconacetobacter diazotrophicus]